jgi:hypothetical protein
VDKTHKPAQGILRTTVLLAQLKLNKQKARELTYTLRNLRTVDRLVLEEIRIRRTTRPPL